MCLCILDFETTGLNTTADDIIEIAIKIYSRKEIYHTLVIPKKPLPKKISELTQITNSMICKDAIHPTQMFREMYQFLLQHKVTHILAHNGEQFDFIFLKLLFFKHNVSYSRFQWIDSIYLFRKIHSLQKLTMPSYSQKNLCQFYQIHQEQAHRAIGDVQDLETLFDAIVTNYSIYQNVYINFNLNKLTELSRGKQYSDILLGYIIQISKFLASTDTVLVIPNITSFNRRNIYLWLEQNYIHLSKDSTEDKLVLQKIQVCL